MRSRYFNLLCLLLIGSAFASSARAGERPTAVVASWEAEAYRDGAPGAAFQDATPGNSGPGRAGDVDLGACSDGAGCASVDDWSRGDWVSYDTPMLEAGTYAARLRVAVPGSVASLRVSFGGGSIEGFMRVPLLARSTGGAEHWVDLQTRPLRLPAGALALYVVQAGSLPLRLNHLQLLRLDAPAAQPPAASPPAAPEPTPARDVTRFAWFYKPPTDGTPPETIAARADVLVLSRHDEPYRERLLALGVAPERMYQYMLSNEIQDPGGCDQKPWGNNAAWYAGDFCRIRDEHPDWFLRDPDGKAIWSTWGGFRWYQMDPGNRGWQDFVVERLREAADVYGWRGVFLDNIDGSPKRSGVPKAGYPGEEEYQAAIERYLARVRAEVIDPRGLKLFANQTLRPSDGVWFRYLRQLDGAMEESCLLDWPRDGSVRYLGPERWEQQLALIERTQAEGKAIICVAQGSRDAADAHRFAYASFLLAADGGALFRYTNSGSYGRFWDDSSYSVELGTPLGPRYRDGDVWRRDFEHYSVAVDPARHSALISER